MRAARYKLTTRLAVGGMGEVWLATDEGPHGYRKTVVVKRMLPEAKAFVDYFTAEARLGARLTHQNIVQVLDFYVDGGQQHLVLEYVEGASVFDIIKRAGLTVDQALLVATQALKGLEFAHNATIDGQPANIVHRDLSPDNLLVSCDAEVKLTDFGIAKATVAWRQQTDAGFKGKWGYISPEALLGQHVDRRADVYAMGVVLYEMLSRQRAFPRASSAYHQTNRIVEGQVEPLARVAPKVPAEVVQIVERMMRPDRYQRFASAAEARQALLRVMPECVHADASLAEVVRRLSARRRRLTSPFLRAEERERLALAHQATARSEAAPLGRRAGAATVPKEEARRDDGAGAEHEGARRGGAAVAGELGATASRQQPSMLLREEASTVPREPAEPRQLDPEATRRTPARARRWAWWAIAAVAGVASAIAGVTAHRGLRTRGHTAAAIAPAATAAPAARAAPAATDAPAAAVAPAATVARATTMAPAATAVPPAVATRAAVAPARTVAPAGAVAPAAPASSTVAARATTRPAAAVAPPPQLLAPFEPPTHRPPPNAKPHPRRGEPASGFLAVERPAQLAQVSVDGVAIGAAPIDAFELSPGEHEVVLAFAAPAPPFAERVTVAAGERVVVRAPVPPPPPAPPPPAKPAPAAIFEAAQDAYIRRDYPRALAQAQAFLALDKSPDAADRGWRLIGSCRCILRDLPGALEAARALERADSRNYLRYICERNGLDLK